MDEALEKRISDQINGNKVMLYMKGTPDSPLCGFSARTVSILKSYKIPFNSFDVLSDDSIRQGLKEFSDWPTFPQLYVNGELIGGCDIVTELHENGELAKILSK